MKRTIIRWAIVEADGQIARDRHGSEILYCNDIAPRSWASAGEQVVPVEITWDDGKGERCTT